jgi:hypothetical protein
MAGLRAAWTVGAVVASRSHSDRSSDRTGIACPVRGSFLAPIAFHSAAPFASLTSTDDLGAASYISPPP